MSENVEHPHTEGSTNASTNISRLSRTNQSGGLSGSIDMSQSRGSGSQTYDRINAGIEKKKKSEVKHVEFGGYGTAQNAKMKEIIEELAQDVDILDKVHAKPGEVLKMQVDYDAEKDDDFSTKSFVKSETSKSSFKGSSMDWGDRKRRKDL